MNNVFNNSVFFDAERIQVNNELDGVGRRLFEGVVAPLNPAENNVNTDTLVDDVIIPNTNTDEVIQENFTRIEEQQPDLPVE